MKTLAILTPDGTFDPACSSILLSYAVFPEAEEKQENFLYTLVTDNIVEANQATEISVPVELLDILQAAPPTAAIQEEAGKALDRGTIAGQLALCACWAGTGCPDLKISVEKVIYLMTCLSAEDETPGQRKLPSERSIWKSWSEFKSSCHLLAYLSFFGSQEEPESSPFDHAVDRFLENPLEVLTLAEGIRLSLENLGLVKACDLYAAPQELGIQAQPLNFDPFPDMWRSCLL